ncbi:MAG: T9SS type A sorting domain-containing protein [Bacteroidia bacterium]|nr:T9SS type A sorting domain-containing protein [Bacteroidia bacterium]
MKIFYRYFLLLVIAALFVVKPAKAQCTFTASVPYYQNFTGLSSTNPLPTCWARSSTVTCVTNSFATNAGFYTSPTATSYFYTNGIVLNAGVVYSVSLFYSTSSNSLNWSDFSLHLATSQTSVGLTQLASASAPVISINYSQLSGTFTVASTGIYYVAIRGISSAACCSNYLLFDDFSITIPCNLNPVNTAIAPSTTFVCLGDTIALNATGATTFSWSTGLTVPSYTTVPNGNTNYFVTGTNTLTGCATTASLSLVVNPRPVMSVFSSTNAICEGNTLTLNGYGNAQYIWSTGSNNNNISVSPSITTIYYLTGFNNFACTSTASMQVVVYPKPIVTAVSSKSVSCSGEQITLSATGAKSYSWSSTVVSAVGATIPVIPTANTVFTITATDSMGCNNSTLLYLSINPCLGIDANQDLGVPRIYPNPANAQISLKGVTANVNVEVFDALGKLVLSEKSLNYQNSLLIQQLSRGIYVLKISEADKTYTLRFVKE